jgi:hypothetical protein
MKTVITFLALLSVLGFAQSIRGARLADPFEGTKWTVTVSPGDANQPGQEKEFQDTLTFKGGQFSSAHFEKAGFKSGTFDEDTRGMGAASFTVEQKSEKGDKLRWTGARTGAGIKGEVKLVKKDGTESTYNFTGEKTN